MSAREVTYYEVVCDEPGCGRTTGDLGSDYTAWSDREGALDEWINSDGVVMVDGRTFCYDHVAGRICDHCDEGRDTAPPDDDGERLCAKCATDAHGGAS